MIVPGYENREDDLASGALDTRGRPGNIPWVRVILFAILAAAAFALFLGCMTVNIDHVVLTDHSTITVNQPKTVTTTTDASIPAGALGL